MLHTKSKSAEIDFPTPMKLSLGVPRSFAQEVDHKLSHGLKDLSVMRVVKAAPSKAVLLEPWLRP